MGGFTTTLGRWRASGTSDPPRPAGAYPAPTPHSLHPCFPYPPAPAAKPLKLPPGGQLHPAATAAPPLAGGGRPAIAPAPPGQSSGVQSTPPLVLLLTLSWSPTPPCCALSGRAIGERPHSRRAQPPLPRAQGRAAATTAATGLRCLRRSAPGRAWRPVQPVLAVAHARGQARPS